MRRSYDEEEERVAAAPPSRPPAQAPVEDEGILELASTIGNRAFADLVGQTDARSADGEVPGEEAFVDNRAGTLQRQAVGGPMAPPLPGGAGATMGLTATLARIRHTTTPAAMAADRIPPRVDIPVAVGISGWSVPMTPVEVAIENAGGGNGTCTLDGAATTTLIGTGGSVTLRGVDQTGSGKGTKLRVIARFGGIVIGRSNPFAVAAIPQNWTISKVSELSGARRGLVVQDGWESDSGTFADLNETEISERVEQTSASGVFAGIGAQNSGYLPGDQLTKDTHGTPASIITGHGVRIAAQTSMFKDNRTGAADIPMANSGYTLSRFSLTFGPGSGWWLMTVKQGAATTARGISSAAGAGSASAFQSA